MYNAITIIIVLSVASVSLAQTDTQTDWSGGDGVSGPVLTWENAFDMEIGVNWNTSSGELILDYTTPMEHGIANTYVRANYAVPVDLDGDGDTDMLGAAGRYSPPYFFSGRIDWWENVDGVGADWLRHDVDNNFDSAPSVCCADLDGDNDMDIIGAAYGSLNNITWWENVDGAADSLTPHIIPTTVESISSIDTADVNGDGFIDLISTDTGNDVIWLENVDGTGNNWMEHVIGYINTPYDVFAADVDGDEDIDLVSASFNGDYISWFENLDGSGTAWEEHDVASDFNGARSVYACDLDGDDDIDVVGAASLGWEIKWWENTDGTGNSWSEHTINDNVNYAFSVYASDINGDGDMDVLGAGFYSDAIIWWENAGGTGLNWNEHIIDDNFDGARDVTAADIDNDGDTDIVGTAQEAGDISWWDVTCCIGLGELVSSILDTEMEAQWDSISWNSNEPGGASVTFQVRSSTDPLYMGTWSEIITKPESLEPYLIAGDRYVQYKTILETVDPGLSPELQDITLIWSQYVGVEQLIVDSWQPAVRIYPNPTDGIADFRLLISEFGRMTLLIYDLHGRVVAIVVDQVMKPGEHSVMFDTRKLQPGVYIVQQSAIGNQQSAIEKLMVVR